MAGIRTARLSQRRDGGAERGSLRGRKAGVQEMADEEEEQRRRSTEELRRRLLVYGRIGGVRGPSARGIRILSVSSPGLVPRPALSRARIMVN